LCISWANAGNAAAASSSGATGAKIRHRPSFHGAKDHQYVSAKPEQPWAQKLLVILDFSVQAGGTKTVKDAEIWPVIERTLSARPAQCNEKPDTFGSGVRKCLRVASKSENITNCRLWVIPRLTAETELLNPRHAWFVECLTGPQTIAPSVHRYLSFVLKPISVMSAIFVGIFQREPIAACTKIAVHFR
jgi:hypothetical protein